MVNLISIFRQNKWKFNGVQVKVNGFFLKGIPMVFKWVNEFCKWKNSDFKWSENKWKNNGFSMALFSSVSWSGINHKIITFIVLNPVLNPTSIINAQCTCILSYINYTSLMTYIQ